MWKRADLVAIPIRRELLEDRRANGISRRGNRRRVEHSKEAALVAPLNPPRPGVASVGRPMPPKVEDMDDAVPGRSPLEHLGYRHRLHELGRAAMQPLHRIPELVRVNFRSHGAMSKGFRREPISDGTQFEWLADILREQQWARRLDGFLLPRRLTARSQIDVRIQKRHVP
jgi:hypothetical protein